MPDCSLANSGGCDANVDLVGNDLGAGRQGHHDLTGNVSEWTFDWWDIDWYSSTSAVGKNVCNVTEASYRVIRGGDFGSSAPYLHAASRNRCNPTFHYYGVGIRCARSAP